jgi:hypothetical protein
LADPYRLISIVAVVAPSGAAGSRWHRYEIAQGRNTIVGYREGVLENVTVAVEGIVEQLNARRLFRNGRGHAAASSRAKAHASEP